jgi:hypothetical protein
MLMERIQRREENWYCKRENDWTSLPEQVQSEIRCINGGFGVCDRGNYFTLCYVFKERRISLSTKCEERSETVENLKSIVKESSMVGT